MTVYEFGNGVKIRRQDLMDVQVQRYGAPGNPNLHEPVEEACLLEAFAREQPAAPVFLDIGAAVGYYAILVKQRFPHAQVVAVDALPRHLQALSANLALNGLAEADVQVHACAVAAADGELDFIDEGYGSGLAANLPYGASSGRPPLRVQARTLTALLDMLPPVHLMKMDIQGAELAVLGAARDALAGGRVTHVLVGTHGPALHEGVRALLREAGYRIAIDDPKPPMQPDGIVLAERV